MADSSLLERYHFTKEEMAEEHFDNPQKTGYPAPELRHRIIYEAQNAYIEEAYFWMIDHLMHDWSFTDLHKLTDVFAASTQSAFFGVSEQRLGLQQEKASAYLKGISEMLKALFQIVREIRIINERLSYYNDTFQRPLKGAARGSEITLKGVWVYHVEMGVKNAASVYGLAQTVGFTILPDLFFRVEVDDSGMDKMLDKPEEYEKAASSVISKIDEKANSLTEFNEKVREVLKRKLVQYYTWKHRTYKELVIRRKFTVKYLRQHYETIRLYMGWIKPYLRNIKRLSLDQKKMDSAELIGAFEGSMIEIEVLATKKMGFKKYRPCVLLHFLYRTKPSLSYIAEGYQRGPGHTGKYDMVMRGYIWTDQQIENYKRMKEEEDLELLSSINSSIREAMDSLGKELKDYLLEAKEEFDEDKIRKAKEKVQERKTMLQTAFEPLLRTGAGLKEMLSPLSSLPFLGTGKKQSAVEMADEKIDARRNLVLSFYQTYKNFKKAHGFVHW